MRTNAKGETSMNLKEFKELCFLINGWIGFADVSTEVLRRYLALFDDLDDEVQKASGRIGYTFESLRCEYESVEELQFEELSIEDEEYLISCTQDLKRIERNLKEAPILVRYLYLKDDFLR